MAQTKSCYIISQIGSPNSDERKWADFLRENIIKPAVTECGYQKPTRADDPEAPLILTGIIEQMFEADLVVADLTNYNPNVFYELGIRHCAQKPVIHLATEGLSPPFDLGENNVIFVSEKYLVVTKAIEDIKSRVQALENNPEQYHSQVQRHIQLKGLELFKKEAGSMEEAFMSAFRILIAESNSHSAILNKLYYELILKPIQSKGYVDFGLGDLSTIMPKDEQKRNLFLKQYRETLLRELDKATLARELAHPILTEQEKKEPNVEPKEEEKI